MDVRELRIGNWVKRNEQPEGFQIESRSFIVCERDPLLYEPIPLTEEWLIKFGFSGSTIDISDKISGCIDSIYFNGICIGTASSEYSGLHRIKYVHQLQNLYFALTGEELTIKE